MSTLLYSLGRWSYRRSWRVLVSWLLLLALATGGAVLFTQGTDNSFSIPGTEAQDGIEQLNRTFPEAGGTAAQLIVAAAPGDRITDAGYREGLAETIDAFEDLDGVLAVTDPFSEIVDGLVSADDTAAIVQLQFAGQATDVSDEARESLFAVSDELQQSLPAAADVAMGGDLFATDVPALTLIEAVGVLVALFVLIVTFRSIAVAWFPLISALIGVGLAIALIFIATAFATVSTTTPMLAIMLGLAVGIDYALFIVARHQDQVREGIDPEESAARASGTAGSAVVFAGVTVLIALIGLSFAGIPFLTTMGVAAAVAVAIAVVVAVTLTPALLGLAGGRVLGWPRFGRRAAARNAVERESDLDVDAVAVDAAAAPAKPRQPHGFAARWVGLVTRHPFVTTVAVVVGLGIVAIPATSLALALPNAGVLPEENEARQAYDLTAEHFGPGFNGPLVMTGTIVTSTDPLGLMDELGAEVERIPGVAAVPLATPNMTADTGIVQIIPETAPDDPATAELVRELRSHHDEWLDEYDVDLTVTGFTAVGIDISDRLGAALLPFGIFVVGLSLVLLAIVFRSVWVPLMAAGGYLLSILAAFGVVAAVFEWGWFAETLHVARVGPVISFMPIIVMGVLFGLAMDYQVFLVSRMREDYVRARRRAAGRHDRAAVPARTLAIDAVRSGFRASARVVTAAAVIMFAVFAAFVPEGDSSIKPIALGLAVGIAVDAFLVRMTLIPALMAILGERAWWFPAWLERALPHFDIEGEAVEHELSLADWPEPQTGAALVAEHLALHDRDDRLYADVALRVDPGETLLVTSPDPRTATALLLTLSGRIDPTGGRLRVAGHLLPGRGAWVRAHVGLAILGRAEDPVAEARAALRGRAKTIVLDDVDALRGASRDQAAALLRDASAARMITLVVSATDVDAALALLAEAGRRDVEVLDLAHPSSAAAAVYPAADAAHTSEVNA